MSRDPALSQAIAIVGSSQELARRLSITPQALSQWSRVPPRRVLDVEAATNGALKRHVLRPDIYPVPDPVAGPVPAPDVSPVPSSV